MKSISELYRYSASLSIIIEKETPSMGVEIENDSSNSALNRISILALEKQDAFIESPSISGSEGILVNVKSPPIKNLGNSSSPAT